MSKRKFPGEGSEPQWLGYDPRYYNKLVKIANEKFLERVRALKDSPDGVKFSNEELIEGNDLVEAEKMFEGLSDSESETELFSEGSTEKEYSDFSDSYDETNTNSDNKSDLAKDLASFVVRRRPPVSHMAEMIKILNKNGVRGLPGTYAKLMDTPKDKVPVRRISAGYVYYHGINSALQKRKELIKDLTVIELDIGIDGSQVFHSSNLSLWPIVGCIVNALNIRPFLIACFEGREKPNDPDELLEEFCAELETLFKNGISIEIDGQIITKQIKVRLFSMDSPARASICQVIGPTGYEGCPLCKFDKKRLGKVIFPVRAGQPRTDEMYKNRSDPDHHHCFSPSLLEKLGLKMVSQFVIDPMHTIDLGVVKRTMAYLKNWEPISERMEAFNKLRPSDFARDCRSLISLPRFKATECRQFLMYGCIVFLKDLVESHIYDHWLLLHVAVRLLSNEVPSEDDIDKAEILVKKYVELYPVLYGEDSVTYIIHSLLHLPHFVTLYGPLDSFSSYKFENYFQKLKSYIGKAQYPLQQIYNRMMEEEQHNKESYLVPSFNSTNIQCNEKDSFVALKINEKIVPVKIVSIRENKCENIFVVKRCLNLKSFYSWPVDSSEIGEVTYDSLHSQEETFNASLMQYKYCRISYKNIFVLIPIIHTAFHKFFH